MEYEAGNQEGLFVPAAEQKNPEQRKCPSAGNKTDELYIHTKAWSTTKAKRLELQNQHG